MRVVAAVLALTFWCGIARAADAYFVRFNAEGRQTSSGIHVLWADEIVFYNTGAQPAVVRFVGVSNGSKQADIPSLTLPSRQVVSLNPLSLAEKWLPIPVPSMWVLHLDIPAGVIVESRDEYHLPIVTGAFPPPSAPLGKVSMPVFKELVAAGQPQVHLGTDLGGNDSRVNVGIYNAAADTAVATIEVRRACDGAVVESRTVTVPENTAVQIGGLGVGSSTDCPATAEEEWARYTIVTVSQPSFTFVSNLNENIVPNPAVSGTFPIVGLAVTKNEHF